MKINQLASEESLQNFKRALKQKINNGFELEERNDKLPFAVLSKKGIKVDHNINFVLSCATLGLWSIAWIYLSRVLSKEKRILIAIDEDGNTFVDKCYN